MARVTTVAKARKSPGACRRCGTTIKTGESYKWFANRIGTMSQRKNFCASCRIRPSDMTTSDKLSTLYSAQEELEDAINDAGDRDALTAALESAASTARDVAQEYLDSIDNMPENLQNSCQCDEMREKSEIIESWADELESAASDIEGMEPEEPEEGEEPGEDGGEAAVLEEARTRADEACGSLGI